MRLPFCRQRLQAHIVGPVLGVARDRPSRRRYTRVVVKGGATEGTLPAHGLQKSALHLLPARHLGI